MTAYLLLGLMTECINIVMTWRQLGFKPKDSVASQALIRLRKEYCDRHECLRCRFGQAVLRNELF